ncbi:glycine cleavage system protein GcvH [Akkermansia glycaniphila]|uniref:Glycine cleavage system H protein n=1 Tax=Akkermansia glycaniphila TaxID=1679444 RepID=A0A1C7PEB4_9BACT|nr:glycine cleavage system protein GcvH [Akkermansia glycaniphila]MBT9449167.1 glycine cleavage system protein GcvH [Akkermansia glycaniphila]OCA03910.1 glycine cleavage system protein H [Akkermansia glycaniphila]SEH70463.1 gcvh: glycine cleavage system h protein [Akkermansia glycaniphila]
MSNNIPDNLLYSRDHEWVDVDGDIATIGISDHAQAELGDVVFVDLPEPGTSIAANDSIAVVESVKAASDVYSPVSGEIIEVNEELGNEPGAVNSDPYGNGWICKIRLQDMSELDSLLSPADYSEFCS